MHADWQEFAVLDCRRGLKASAMVTKASTQRVPCGLVQPAYVSQPAQADFVVAAERLTPAAWCLELALTPGPSPVMTGEGSRGSDGVRASKAERLQSVWSWRAPTQPAANRQTAHFLRRAWHCGRRLWRCDARPARA